VADVFGTGASRAQRILAAVNGGFALLLIVMSIINRKEN
jgi:hypothetical protein